MSSISYDFRETLVDDIDPSARDEALINHIAGDDELRQDFVVNVAFGRLDDMPKCAVCKRIAPFCDHDDLTFAGIAPAWDAGK